MNTNAPQASGTNDDPRCTGGVRSIGLCESRANTDAASSQAVSADALTAAIVVARLMEVTREDFQFGRED